jgi:hypothetical protein
MMYDHDIFIEQYPLVKQFIRNITLFRLLTATTKKIDIKSEFWIQTINADLLQATNYWCMVFGSDWRNKIHWKKLPKINIDKLQQSFRAGVAEELKISFDVWVKYQEEMVRFRNSYTAHRELNYNKHVPTFDMAIEVAFFYDKWVRKVIQPNHLDILYLEQYAEIYRKQNSELLLYLVNETQKYQNLLFHPLLEPP